MTITKTKATSSKTKAVLTPPKTATTLKAEEFILLHKELLDTDAFTLLKNYEKLKKELQEIAINGGAAATDQFVFSTDKGDVVFKAAAKKVNIVDKDAMRKMLGQKVFNEIASVTLGELEKYLSVHEIEKFTETVDGSRALAGVVLKS